MYSKKWNEELRVLSIDWQQRAHKAHSWSPIPESGWAATTNLHPVGIILVCESVSDPDTQLVHRVRRQWPRMCNASGSALHCAAAAENDKESRGETE